MILNVRTGKTAVPAVSPDEEGPGVQPRDARGLGHQWSIQLVGSLELLAVQPDEVVLLVLLLGLRVLRLAPGCQTNADALEHVREVVGVGPGLQHSLVGQV